MTLTDQMLTDIANAIGIETEIGLEALRIGLENIQTLDRKQQDYGSQNISRHGQVGVLVRCDDKTARIANLIKHGNEAKNEPLLDSWLDLANYGLIGALLTLNRWK